MPSRSPSRPGAPICGGGASCSGPLTRPTSSPAPIRSIAPRCSTRWPAAPAISSAAADKAPLGPRPDHRLERRDRRRSGRPGRPGAAEIGRDRPRPRARRLAARRWRAGQPLARPSRSPWSRYWASCAPSIIAARRDVPEWLTDALAASVARLALGDPGRRGAVELAGRQHGEPPPRRRRDRRRRPCRPPAPPGARLGLSAAAGARRACSSSTPRRRRRRARSPAPAPRRWRSNISDGPARLIVNCGGAGEAQGRAAGGPRAMRCAPPPPIRR